MGLGIPCHILRIDIVSSDTTVQGALSVVFVEGSDLKRMTMEMEVASCA